ncbi:MAG: lysophospholipid acyltransferase family protein [Armatimonadota bacterium]|nr:lysophospholipid acyltransferase family protein [Armatimonadota bacterium]
MAKTDSKDLSRTFSTERAKRLPPQKRALKLLGRITFWLLFKTSRLLRPWIVELVGNVLGTMFFVVSKRYRSTAIANLEAAFGSEKTPKEIRQLAREVFKHFARESLQFFRLISMTREEVDRLVEVEGLENLDAALAKGKGCIAVTAHYGNWELLARKLVILGYPVNVIARDSDDPGMTGIATRIRETAGYKVFDKDQPIIGAFRRLKNNEILGILPDQNDFQGIPITFFNRPAATATGPAFLSIRSGAPIVPLFARRLPDKRYKLVIYPQIEFVPSGNQEEDIRTLTFLLTAAIEQEIRSNPSQWLWLHDRWKYAREVTGNARTEC